MPKFPKKLPKNWRSYFNAASDEAFQRRHPIGYNVLMGCGIAALVLPLILFAWITESFLTTPNSAFLLLAVAGCLIIGIGLFNIVAAWIGQYLGHAVTAGCFLLGGALVAISYVLMYVPDVYALFDEAMVNYYFFSLLFLALPPLFYFMFRVGADSCLTKRLGAKKLSELKRGKKNFWWYAAVQREYRMGWMYHANKLVTILYPVTLMLALCFGWIRVVTPVISGLYALMSVPLAAMSLFATVQRNRSDHGAAFVLIARSRNNGVDSIFFDLFWAAFPLLAVYVHISMTLNLLLP